MLARLSTFLVLYLCVVAQAWSHDLPVNQMVNAIVRVDGAEADLVARVPMDLLRGVPFPLRQGRYDVAAAGLSIELAEALLTDAFVLAENGERLKPTRVEGRLVPVSDRSFDRFDHAFAELRAPVDPAVSIPQDTGYLVVHLAYPVRSARSRFEVRSQVAVDVGVVAPLTVRFQRADGPMRAMMVPGGAGPVDLDPAWYRAAGGFVVLGIEHILSGADHLLFLLCLVVPVRRVRAIVPVITAFTVAHSVTLIASAMGIAPRGAWFPPLVEAAIAASIVYTAAENIFVPAISRRWLLSCIFGLVHGFGFSNALGDSLQFAGQHLVLALLAFNVGIEAGQLGVLCVGVPVLILLRRWLSVRRVVVALSGLGAAIGGFWLVERWRVLRQLGQACDGAMCMDRDLAWALPVLGASAVAAMACVLFRHRGLLPSWSQRSGNESR